MDSFISSSKTRATLLGRLLRHEIALILASAAAIIVLYALFIGAVDPHVTIGATQWGTNRIRAEQYIYAKTLPAAVIVGSSLSARLPQQYLGKDIYSLALSGGSSLTGLDIIAKTNRLPACVIIEANYIYRTVDQHFIDVLFPPVISDARRAVKAFRYEYQPVNVAISTIYNTLRRSEEGRINKKVDPEIVKNALALSIEHQDEFPEETDLEPALAELRRYVTMFQEKNVRVIFLQMPVHLELAATKAATVPLEKMQELFPESAYAWITFENIYQTTDGQHLDYKDSVTVAQDVARDVADFTGSPPG